MSYKDAESEAQVAVRRIDDKHLVVLFVSLQGHVRIITVYFASNVDRLIRRN